MTNPHSHPTLRIQSHREAYESDLPAFALREGLVDLESAQTRDVVAIQYLYSPERFHKPRPISVRFMARTADGGYLAKPAGLLSEMQLRRFGPALMPWLDMENAPNAFAKQIADMCRSDTVPRRVRVIFNEHAAFISTMEIEMFTSLIRDQGQIRESDLPGHVRLVVPPTASAHEDIEMRPKVSQLLDFAQDIMLIRKQIGLSIVAA